MPRLNKATRCSAFEGGEHWQLSFAFLFGFAIQLRKKNIEEDQWSRNSIENRTSYYKQERGNARAGWLLLHGFLNDEGVYS